MPVRTSVVDAFRSHRANAVSLSRYFPKNTCYFYGYPSGESSGFLNKVPPAVEELVSARPLVCAGGDIAVVAFANSLDPKGLDFLRRRNPKLFSDRQTVVALPPSLDATVEDRQRNLRVKQSLKQLVKPGTLVMAQPFLDEDVEHLYQISPRLTNWLNDKNHLTSYIPARLLPARFATFASGLEMAESKTKLPIPCVVKVSSSSAGDGVYICKDERSLQAAKKVLASAPSTIIVEQYIETKVNYGIQFGVPDDESLPIEIIGVSEQLTTNEGEFIGGVINAGQSHRELIKIKELITGEILPQVRELGWYGVGCFDVLVDASGATFIIDCNFRMTGMTAFLMLAANNQINSSLVSFGGEFHGSLAELENVLTNLPLASDVQNPLLLVSIAKHHGIYRFNGALKYRDKKRVPVMARQLLKAGVSSKALEQLT